MIRDMTAAELTAHKREMASAKRFGEKIESHDSGGHLIAYRWQGKLYIAEWSMQPSPQPPCTCPADLCPVHGERIGPAR